jgi:hypothetical protein
MESFSTLYSTEYLYKGAVAAIGTWYMPLIIGLLSKYYYDFDNPEGHVIDYPIPDDKYDFVISEYRVHDQKKNCYYSFIYFQRRVKHLIFFFV